MEWIGTRERYGVLSITRVGLEPVRLHAFLHGLGADA